MNYQDLSNQVWPITETRLDNNMIDRIGVVYIEKWNWAFFEWTNRVWSMIKTNQDNDMTNYTSLVYAKTKFELLELIKQGTIHCKD